MEVKAILRHYRVAPRKVRLVTDLIRSLHVNNAIAQLKNLNKKSSNDVLTLLNSAIANAVNNNKLKKEHLFIKEIKVDGGPALKRWKPRAHGRAGRILKFTSHITIVLSDGKKEEVSEEKNVKKIKKEVKENTDSIKTVADKKIKKDKKSKSKKVIKSSLKSSKKETGDK
jgi:large subunit ribosomal protein L22